MLPSTFPAIGLSALMDKDISTIIRKFYLPGEWVKSSEKLFKIENNLTQEVFLSGGILLK